MGAITRRRKFLDGCHRRYCVRPACQEGERSIQERAARPGFEPSRAGGLRPRHPCRLFWSAATSSHRPNKAAWFMSQFPDRAGPGNWYRWFVSELIPGPAGTDVLTSGGLTTRHNQTWRPICCFAGVCCRSPRLRNERLEHLGAGAQPDCAKTWRELSRIITGPLQPMGAGRGSTVRWTRGAGPSQGFAGAMGIYGANSECLAQLEPVPAARLRRNLSRAQPDDD
jgi:hypothetical protein